MMASSKTKTTTKPGNKPVQGKSRRQEKALEPARGGTRRPLLLSALALAVLVVAAYSNSLSNGFVWDDHQQILNNPAVQAGAPLGRIFSADVRFDTHSQGLENSDYRPLQMVTYRLLMGAFGADAAAFHACSLLFALLCTLAAFLVFLQLTHAWRQAITAGALFALFPVHSEAVDWIAALPELGFSLCCLSAFACFLQSERRTASAGLPRPPGATPRRGFAPTSWILFGLALLWKETAIVFPILIAVYVLLLGKSFVAPRKQLLTALRASAPYWLIAALYLGLRWAVLGSVASAPRDWDLSSRQQGLNLLALMERYWGKLAWPFRLNAYYTFTPLRSFAAPRALMVLLVAAVATAGFVFVLRRHRQQVFTASDSSTASDRQPLMIFALCWVVITLLPAMNLAALGRNPFTDRYMYLPSAGFCLLLTLVATFLLERVSPSVSRYAAPATAALVALAFFYVTVERNPDWKDDATLFGVTLVQSPDAPFVHNMVATAESSDPAKADDAAGNYAESIDLALGQIPPDRVDAVVAYRGLAWIKSSRGQAAEAMALLDRAGSVAPADADTDGERGLVLAQAGRGEEAVPFLQRALAAAPGNENVLSALGLIANEVQHNPQRAAGLFQQALNSHRAEDDFAASQRNNLATVYSELGNYADAAKQLRTAIRILPADPTFHANLANTLAAQGKFAEAQTEAQTAVQLAPQVPAFAELLQKITQSTH